VAKARVIQSINDVARERWDACFPGRLENHDYLAAVEAAGLPGFEWRYVLVEEDERVLAAAPAFFTDYRLDTTLTAFGRGLVSATRRLAQCAFTVRLASLGSPCAEDVSLGFHPTVGGPQRQRLLRAMVKAFETAAMESGCWLLAVKDAPHSEGLWAEFARSAGYQASPGMPSAELPIDFPDIDTYLARLSAATRKDMRRKLKAMADLRIEQRNDIAGLEDRVMELYRQTRRRSDMQFEELTPAYFSGVLHRLGDRASCVLYYAGDDLLGFNLLLRDGETLLDKFFCMESERGPQHNLYFVSWFTNIRLCLEAGLKRYQSGQAGYGAKVRLGSRLAPTQMYFRHRRALVNSALRWAAPLLADDPTGQSGAAA
jgi:predicted N-acyltransferase